MGAWNCDSDLPEGGVVGSEYHSDLPGAGRGRNTIPACGRGVVGSECYSDLPGGVRWGRNTIPTYRGGVVGSEYHSGSWVVQSRNAMLAYRRGVVGSEYHSDLPGGEVGIGNRRSVD